MTADEIGTAYGLPAGDVRRWIREAVIPSGLTGDRLEHAVVSAYLTRPSTIARLDGDPAELHDTWSAAVRESLDRAESVCPTTTDDRSAASAA
ncbi:hypothetical protein GCM10009613_11620 [Pseudonocardia kongjuensis]|uniref:Uncharacterized protein n=1 Tax=Pseudonocardia kongjuensis TaxID=102227 RepID=A0ABN1XJ43_9PSEU